MDSVLLARLQFAATNVYHYFFVPLTLGLVILVAILETMYVKTGDEKYKILTKFWGKLFLINFAMGVATGIVMEFQFGMNWSEYSRFVGDIFGAPLAIEALLAFFLESTFLGVWVFGWDKLSKKLHLATIWLVAIGSNLSALWILIANSFMQEPVGFVLRNGRAEMTDFFALIFNPNVWVQFPHVLTAGLTTGAFFMAGISAYHLLKKSDNADLFQRSFKISMIVAVISTFLTILIGHTQAQHTIRSQPMKMAAAEALWETEEGASMSLFTIGDEKERKDLFAIKLPGVLSLMAYNTFDGTVKGIKNLQKEYEEKYGPGDYVPPVAISYWTFRAMVGAGTLMFFMALFAFIGLLRENYQFKDWFMKATFWAIALPYIANTSGWLLTEVGRIPWIVFGLMRVEDGVSSSVSGGEVLLTLIGFILLYGILMVVDVILLKKYASLGIPLENKE